MTNEQFRALRTGDHVRASSGDICLIVGLRGSRVTAVRIHDGQRRGAPRVLTAADVIELVPLADPQHPTNAALTAILQPPPAEPARGITPDQLLNLRIGAVVRGIRTGTTYRVAVVQGSPDPGRVIAQQITGDGFFGARVSLRADGLELVSNEPAPLRAEPSTPNDGDTSDRLARRVVRAAERWQRAYPCPPSADQLELHALWMAVEKLVAHDAGELDASATAHAARQQGQGQ